MSNTIIKLEDISKQYRLGVIGSGTLRADLQSWWAKIRGKENPLLTIGSENKLNTIEGEYVWALRNVNLEVQQGEVLGIIGKNGAGKSTLLKLLSRITTPTTGRIKVRGRIASLLEVGTGFHSELTGRENIFLNGSILGMKKEIERKFDEIVDFSGVGKYVDTPVKRYSSGMYVRLAFAVAAYLDPEILIVDEVLAVGDAEFQKKAIGKMQDISKGEGRTVLFVSHNMGAVKSLCSSALLLQNGTVIDRGTTHTIIDRYMGLNEGSIYVKTFPEAQNKPAKIRKIELLNIDDTPITKDIKCSDSFKIRINYDIYSQIKGVHVTLRLHLAEGETVFSTTDSEMNPNILLEKREIGNYSVELTIPSNLLAENFYTITCSISIPFLTNYDFEMYALKFNIVEQIDEENWVHTKKAGYFSLKLPWRNC